MARVEGPEGTAVHAPRERRWELHPDHAPDDDLPDGAGRWLELVAHERDREEALSDARVYHRITRTLCEAFTSTLVGQRAPSTVTQ